MNAILKKRVVNNGVFIPWCLFPNQRPFFAIDNTDKKSIHQPEKDNLMVQKCQQFNNTWHNSACDTSLNKF